MSDGGQFMREVLQTGSCSTFGKSLRALLGYINEIRLHPANADGGEECFQADNHALKNKEEIYLKESCALDLRIRDLRLLDVNFHPSNVYSILVRKHSVLLSLDPFKAIVMSDRIIIVVSPQRKTEENMDHILRIFENHFKVSHGDAKQRMMNNNEISLKTEFSNSSDGENSDDSESNSVPVFNDMAKYPLPLGLSPSASFEYQAYELIFTTVHTLHCHEYNAINKDVQNFLVMIFPRSAVNIPYVLQEKMRYLKDNLSRMATKVGAFRRALSLILEDDELMALMNLSRLHADPNLYATPLGPDMLATHDEIEGLLETHLFDIDSLEAKLSYLLNTLQNAEASVSLKLDVAQDKIMIANTTLSIAAVMIAFASYWTGVFGMSLDNTITIQNIFGLFEAVYVLTFMIILGGIPLIIYYYESTGVLPRLLRRKEPAPIRRGADVMGMTNLISYHEN